MGTTTTDAIVIHIDRVTYCNRETGYVVVRGTCGSRPATAVGILPEAAVGTTIAGTEYRLKGTWERSKYGYQFAFSEAQLLTNRLFHFLARAVKGIGQKLARELIDHYGEAKLLDILEHRPDELLTFKGIKHKKLARIRASWSKQRNLQALAVMLLPHDVTPALMVRIHNYFGDQAAATVQENPYRLTEVRGIGFRTADEVARKLGLAVDAPERVRAAVSHILLDSGEKDGHTFLPYPVLMEKLGELLPADGFTIEAGRLLDELRIMAATDEVTLDSRDLQSPLLAAARVGAADQETGIPATVALSAYRFMEERLLAFAQEHSRDRHPPLAGADAVAAFIAKSEQKLGFPFADEQRRIISLVGTGRRRFYALSGYAGTGKSTISRALLDLLAELYCDRKEIVCCAFTGMASARIRKLTGYQAYTIHTLLKYRGGNRFEHGPENPLPYRVVLLDEAGMVNLQLFYRLALAITENTVFILVGDPAQLPPIGAGNVFGDLLPQPFLAHVALERIYRQDPESVLVYFANIIRTGKTPPDYRQEYRDFAFLPQDIDHYFELRKKLSEAEMKEVRDRNNDRIRERLLALAREATERLEHPAWNFQILTPLRRGPLGTEVLNAALQEIFNPGGARPVNRFGMVLREGDKVVHLQNRDMDTLPWRTGMFQSHRDRSRYETRRVFNGSVGLVRHIDHEEEEFFVLYPDYSVVRYEFDRIFDLIDLAYCLTVHKAQGSQYREVAIPLTNSHFIMLNNRWFYTAVTRAAEKVHLVGQEYAFTRACTNIDAAKRHTYLDRCFQP
ncbi:MAG: AAA family ATPase [Deltaproteobacteria bacterium]|nr:AAA family ATPase [Candidatus Anaeroferrophillacea bacterium]